MDPPVKPDDSDCCGSSCNPCILDVYEEQLKKFNKFKDSSSTVANTTKNCISPSSYSIFKTIDIEKNGHDAFLFTFEYVRPHKRPTCDLQDLSVFYAPGQYFMLKVGKMYDEFSRAYTPIPIATKSDKLQFTTLIKIYEGGRMSNYLRRLPIGKETIWRGPYGGFSVKFENKYMFLIGQGTGVAPLFSIINEIVNNENCFTFLKLFFCCQSGNHIYLRDQLYELQSYWNFSYEVFLSKTDEIAPKYNEIIHMKKLNEESIQKYLTDKWKDIQVLISGSKSFMKDIRNHVLINSNIPEESIFLF